ncbi:serine hydrolase [Microbulbifer sp. YPW16]|uniref:serine hydrolase domain-containing protein n=1 Tax=unclassified Microbulbifer TaxID=2619833 RepID=UPI001E478871|nr:serine hydrolase domain-containing protein [Microbulbifer sp. YPW16]UHQ57003.1 beta-lactamase family protein [Microbulbifer sp. YPW16]
METASHGGPGAGLDRELDAIARDFEIPALSVAVIASGELVYTGGAGYEDQEQEVPVTGDTRFRIASISKLFAAQAIMQLAEAGKLDLDDPIADYLPGFEQSPITIRQLLTHSSGLSDLVRPVGTEEQRTEQAYFALVNTAMEITGTEHGFEYSDTGFNLLGAIISRASSKAFPDYIQQHILTPVNMRHSGYYDGQQGTAPEVSPTYQGKVLTEAQRRPFDTSFYPSEGVVSTAGDLGRWLVATLNQDNRLLSRASYSQMLEPRVKTTWGDIHIGLGWQVYEVDGRFIARHPGSIRGYKSLLLSYPREGNAIILLTNAAKAPRFDIADRLAEKLRQAKVWR